MILPALTVRQPWAGMIVLGWKDVENRSRAILKKYIGQTILIHAGKALEPGFDPSMGNMFNQAFAEATARGVNFSPEQCHEYEKNRDRFEESFWTGGIVGAVDVSLIMNKSQSPWAEPGCWHICLNKARPLCYHPCRGFQNVFKVDYPSMASNNNCILGQAKVEAIYEEAEDIYPNPVPLETYHLIGDAGREAYKRDIKTGLTTQNPFCPNQEIWDIWDSAYSDAGLFETANEDGSITIDGPGMWPLTVLNPREVMELDEEYK